jgi:hypothetical protein
MGALYHRQVESTRNPTEPERKITITFTESEVKFLSRMLNNCHLEEQRRVADGELGFDMIKSKLLLDKCQEALD